MSVTYAMAITANQATQYLEQGTDFLGGFVVDAADLAAAPTTANLIALFHLDLPGSPFAADRPIDVLEIPAAPFLQVRHAVGPLHPQAVLGGIIEQAPFDGSGRVRAGSIDTDLLWMEPTRVPTGTHLLRYYPGKAEPELRGIYHGITWGWEDVAHERFSAFTPSNLIGPAISREWAEVPVDLEIGEDGQPEALQLVCPTAPEAEDGFELVESGMYAKRIAYDPSLDVHEPHLIGRVNSIPVRVIRTLRGEDGTTLAWCMALLLDMPLVLSRGFERWAPAMATITVPLDDVHAQLQPVAAPSFDVSTMPAANLLPPETEDMDRMVNQSFMIMSAVAPLGWDSMAVLVQLIGPSATTGALAVTTTEDGTKAPTALPVVPSAMITYGRWIKEHHVDPDAGAPLSIRLDFDAATHNVNIELNYLNEPEFADEADASAWQAELDAYPRSEEKTPAWLKRRAAGEASSEDNGDESPAGHAE